MLYALVLLAMCAAGENLSGDSDLLQRNLIMPIQGIAPKDLRDTFDEARPGGKRHGATDILAPRGTPIRAMDDGVIRKLFLSKPGGNTIYEFDQTQTYCIYYAHLDRYAAGLKEGMAVRRGDVIGYVGATGDAPAGTPHLHLEITKLDANKHWWLGTPINPYPILVELARKEQAARK
jgi:murein DD-endopeptidase MepM/ murein hydrolase activator NlpD